MGELIRKRCRVGKCVTGIWNIRKKIPKKLLAGGKSLGQPPRGRIVCTSGLDLVPGVKEVAY